MQAQSPLIRILNESRPSLRREFFTIAGCTDIRHKRTMLLRNLLLPALFIFLCPAHAAFTSDIFIRDSDLIEEVRTDYRELRSLALRIFEICPPGDCLYIGIGQSPTPLLALLESVTGEPTVNIPLSDVRQLHDIADPDI